MVIMMMIVLMIMVSGVDVDNGGGEVDNVDDGDVDDVEYVGAGGGGIDNGGSGVDADGVCVWCLLYQCCW